MSDDDNDDDDVCCDEWSRIEVEDSEEEMVDDMTQVCVKSGKVRGVNTCF